MAIWKIWITCDYVWPGCRCTWVYLRSLALTSAEIKFARKSNQVFIHSYLFMHLGWDRAVWDETFQENNRQKQRLGLRPAKDSACPSHALVQQDCQPWQSVALYSQQFLFRWKFHCVNNVICLNDGLFNADGNSLTVEDYEKVQDVKELLVTEETSAHRKDLILMYLNWVNI